MSEESKIDDEDSKKLNRLNVIYKALEDGWTVKKSNINSKTFEFTKNQSLDSDYKGLVVFSNKATICEEIQQHLDTRKSIKMQGSQGTQESQEIVQKTKRSISTPILKN